MICFTIWVEPRDTWRVKCPAQKTQQPNPPRLGNILANAVSTVFQKTYATFYVHFAEIKVSFSTSLTFVVDVWTQLVHVVNQLQLTVV